ncbi:hypothetical protein QTP70_003065 [Hemibagrus guttatus]|uniref:Uncharacterized protein n=1 Tax=Hemibagrus guttatus TaxID=175788 RepID=A0AAE0V9V0_9TELE|nr:hypothetical protein QTP70_003065 [Hemibagrus guttatus]
MWSLLHKRNAVAGAFLFDMTHEKFFLNVSVCRTEELALLGNICVFRLKFETVVPPVWHNTKGKIPSSNPAVGLHANMLNPERDATDAPNHILIFTNRVKVMLVFVCFLFDGKLSV